MKKHIPFIIGSILICLVFFAVHLNTHKQVHIIAESVADVQVFDEAGKHIQNLNHFERWVDIDKGQTVSFKNVSGTHNASFIIGSKSYFVPKGQTITVKL